MRYGHFDDERREYVISRPDTPLPWINCLGSEDSFGIISDTTGGHSFYRDARLRRLTRYRYNNAPLDLDGRYLELLGPLALLAPGAAVKRVEHWQLGMAEGLSRAAARAIAARIDPDRPDAETAGRGLRIQTGPP